MITFQRTPLARAVSAALTGSAIVTVAAAPAQAQQPVLEEITVTAQKREESLQDVPVSLQVLGNQQLEQLNLNNFASYIEFLPTVTYEASTPGLAQVYMRGVSNGAVPLHSGSLPSVGVYLDEQPVTTINHVIDVHMYDIARIEALGGPQGTFFGASSAAGTLRIITNKPEIGETEGGFDVGLNTIRDGGTGYSFEGYTNLPLGDRAAVRLVGWYVEDAGYIDNVPVSVTMQGSGDVVDNSAVVEEDFNESTKFGARALLKIDLNDNWTLTPGLMAQEQKSDGYFTHDPEDLGELQHGRYFDEFYDNSWYQASLTLEGDIGGMNFVYAGAYFDMDDESSYDYTHYAQYLDNFYGYSYGSCYHYDSTLTNCTNPQQRVLGDEQFEKQSHEIRLQSPQDQRFRWMVGAFMQRQEHNFDLRWDVPDMDPNFDPARLASWPYGTVVLGTNSVWQTRQDRVDRDRAAFTELSFDFTENFYGTLGYRYFDFENSLSGYTGGLNRCLDSNDQPLYPCYPNANNVNDVSKGNGDIWKVNLNFNVTDDALIYTTYSEGFRPGGVNRSLFAPEPKYNPDFVNNYEIGWKTTLLDGRMRFNGAVYYLEWDDFQLGFIDFSISPLTIIVNPGNSETTGVEFDLVFAATDELTLSLATSYNDAQTTTPYWQNRDDEVAGLPPTAPKGTEMPLVPELQATGIARYEFVDTRWPMYLQAAVSYQSDSWSELPVATREKQAAYTLVNLAAGIELNEWHVDLFLDNVTDERAELVRYNANYFDPFGEIIEASDILVNRPFTVGLRVGRNF